jgi:DNA adenine methylase
MSVRRPITRWHGGKFVIAPWIISAMPPHRTYVEPFGGGASVLMRKQPAEREVLSDLDPLAVNLYRVLADADQSRDLAFDAWLTPYRRSVFRDIAMLAASDNPIHRARSTLIRGTMAFSSSTRSGYRDPRQRSDRSTSPSDDWYSYRHAVPGFHRRLRSVEILCEPAVDVMRKYDGDGTLHYVDPPYVHATRSDATHAYAHEMTDADHRDLLSVLSGLAGMVILSGYPSPLYDDALPGWSRLTRRSLDNGATWRTECLWLNPAAAAASPLFAQGELFEEIAA